ncbi:unnamed protein product [Diamesa hyperborea]
MENVHLKEFSPDQKLFALIENDGKLKIWDVETNVLKQEYVPNLHLSTPCSAFKWIRVGTVSKKKTRGSDVASTLYIVLGTNRGGLALYSYATAKLEATFKGDGHGLAVTSIVFDGNNFLYTTGLDCKIIKWNIKKCQQESVFECGPEKPTAVSLIQEEEMIISASKTIKVFNGTTEKVAQTFTGHSSNIIILRTFSYQETNYIISASKTDRNLCLWELDEEDSKTIKSGAASTFSLNSAPTFFDINVTEDSLQIACVSRNDSLQFFELNLSNIKNKKPIKPTFTLEIASETTTSSNVDHIPVTSAAIINENILIGYGDMLMKFELISIQQPQKNNILVRKDPMKMTVKKTKEDGKVMNVVTPLLSANAEYLNVVSSRKPLKPVEIPLETRIENLKVADGKRPNAKKLTQQLIQGLHSSDAVILRNVLRQTDEETVRLTVKYLPSQYVLSFVNELSLLMAKKTAGSETALLWLRHLIQTHASHLMAFGVENLNATFGTCLGIIDHRAQSLAGLSRLRGRLELLVRQIKQNSDIDDEVSNENLLVYEEDDESLLDNSSSEDENYDDFEDDDQDSGHEKMNGKSGGSEDEGMDMSD